MLILGEKESSDTEALVYAMTLVNKVSLPVVYHNICKQGVSHGTCNQSVNPMTLVNTVVFIRHFEQYMYAIITQIL